MSPNVNDLKSCQPVSVTLRVVILLAQARSRSRDRLVTNQDGALRAHHFDEGGHIIRSPGQSGPGGRTGWLHAVLGMRSQTTVVASRGNCPR